MNPMKGNSLSAVTYVPPIRHAKVDDPAITKNRWFAAHQASQLALKLERNVLGLNFILFLIVGVATLSSTTNILFIAGVMVAYALVAYLLAAYVYPAISRFISNYGEKREVTFRQKHAHTVLKALAQADLNIIAYGGKPPMEIIATDNTPALIDVNGVRYRLNYLQWDGSGSFSLSAYLDDTDAKAAIKRRLKQERIDSFVEHEEQENGPMSKERKSGFLAALKWSL